MFNLEKVEFFNPFYNSKSIDTTSVIKYTSKSTFFRNIYKFINRVKDITRAKGNILLR